MNDNPVAWQLELLCPGFSYLHHLAFDEAWKKYSPGKQLLFKSMERCWKEGRVFDFLPAPFAYKESYTNQSEPAHELHWIKKSIRGRIARKLITWNMNWRKKMRERSPVSPPRLPGRKLLRPMPLISNKGFAEPLLSSSMYHNQ